MTIIHGDCIEEMAKLETNCADGVITDPPYNLAFMGKKWDDLGTPKKFQRWCRTWGTELRRILKPGAFGCIFCSPKTVHRLTCGLEDAGFDIRNRLMWLYVDSFPKGQDISQAIDDHLGLEREKGPERMSPDGIPYSNRQVDGHTIHTENVYGESKVDADKWFSTLPASELAELWNDYRTCLKFAWEPIVLIRNPKEGTYVENIIEYGVGALNIGGCRIPINVEQEQDSRIRNPEKNIMRVIPENDDRVVKFHDKSEEYVQQLYDLKGRYPTNVFINEMIAELFDLISGVEKPGKISLNKDINRKNRREDPNHKEEGYFTSTSPNMEAVSNYGDGGGMSKSFYTCPTTDVVYGDSWAKRSHEHYGLKDGGGLGKFFYVPKARNEKKIGLEEFPKGIKDTTRNQPIDNPFNRNKPTKNIHPTVKPLKLITYLVRLIKPPGFEPVIIDPFLGSGTTYIACLIEGCKCIGIEKEEKYIEIAEARLSVPLESYEKYTDSPIPAEKDENQSQLTSFSDWL